MFLQFINTPPESTHRNVGAFCVGRNEVMIWQNLKQYIALCANGGLHNGMGNQQLIHYQDAENAM